MFPSHAGQVYTPNINRERTSQESACQEQPLKLEPWGLTEERGLGNHGPSQLELNSLLAPDPPLRPAPRRDREGGETRVSRTCGPRVPRLRTGPRWASLPRTRWPCRCILCRWCWGGEGMEPQSPRQPLLCEVKGLSVSPCLTFHPQHVGQLSPAGCPEAPFPEVNLRCLLHAALPCPRPARG